MIKKIVLNKCYGGFDISEEVMQFIGEEYVFDVKRTDETLIESIEKLGSKRASGRFGQLEVVEYDDRYIPLIESYDGIESMRLLPKEHIVKEYAEKGDMNSLIEYLRKCVPFISGEEIEITDDYLFDGDARLSFSEEWQEGHK